MQARSGVLPSPRSAVDRLGRMARREMNEIPIRLGEHMAALIPASAQCLPRPGIGMLRAEGLCRPTRTRGGNIGHKMQSFGADIRAVGARGARFDRDSSSLTT